MVATRECAPNPGAIGAHPSERDPPADRLLPSVHVQSSALAAVHDLGLAQRLLALPHLAQHTALRTAPLFCGDDVFEQRHPATAVGAASTPARSGLTSRTE